MMKEPAKHFSGCKRRIPDFMGHALKRCIKICSSFFWEDIENDFLNALKLPLPPFWHCLKLNWSVVVPWSTLHCLGNPSLAMVTKDKQHPQWLPREPHIHGCPLSTRQDRNVIKFGLRLVVARYKYFPPFVEVIQAIFFFTFISKQGGIKVFMKTSFSLSFLNSRLI